jgi:lysozyme
MKLDSNPRYPTRWFDEPPQAVELAKRFEGFHRVQRGDPGRAHPYTCRGATGPSDTVGSAIANTQRSSIIEAEEEACLGEDLRTALDGTLRFCPILAAETEARLVAIVDFTFNLGAGRLQTSTPRQRVNGSTGQRGGLGRSPDGDQALGLWGRQSPPWARGAARGGGRAARRLIRTGDALMMTLLQRLGSPPPRHLHIANPRRGPSEGPFSFCFKGV